MPHGGCGGVHVGSLRSGIEEFDEINLDVNGGGHAHVLALRRSVGRTDGLVQRQTDTRMVDVYRLCSLYSTYEQATVGLGLTRHYLDARGATWKRDSSHIPRACGLPPPLSRLAMSMSPPQRSVERESDEDNIGTCGHMSAAALDVIAALERGRIVVCAICRTFAIDVPGRVECPRM